MFVSDIGVTSVASPINQIPILKAGQIPAAANIRNVLRATSGGSRHKKKSTTYRLR